MQIHQQLKMVLLYLRQFTNTSRMNAMADRVFAVQENQNKVTINFPGQHYYSDKQIIKIIKGCH